MILVPIFALFVGAALALILHLPPISGVGGQYLALGCLAGLDTVCGGIRSGLEGKFHNDVFVTGFVSNVLIACFIAWLGDQIFINMFLAVALVLGSRIFTNLSLIRRYGLTKLQDARARREQQIMAAQASAQSEVNS